MNMIKQLSDDVKQEDFKKLSLEQLKEKASSLPQDPGCYLMLNQRNEVIYVGKAKNLKKRVISYFNNSAKSPKTQILVSHIVNFNFIITHNDAESFVLENNLIKNHTPRYNIRMRDDKSYPYVSLDRSHSFPRFEYVRRPKKNKNKELFGPFPHGSDIAMTLKLIVKAFQLRDCSDHEFSNRKEPCILYQMHQCSAPCVQKVSQQEYARDVKDALGFFESSKAAIKSLELLKDRMIRLAEAQMFERAAMLRDQITGIEGFLEKELSQNVELNNEENSDIISYHIGSEEIELVIYMMRSGLLLGHKSFNFLNTDLIDSFEEEMISFLLQYYTQTAEELPHKIILDVPKELKLNFEQALNAIIDQKIKTPIGLRDYKTILDSAQKYAQESQRLRLTNKDSIYVGLNKLKEFLKLKEMPRLVECYDIAIFQGKSPTASQIVFYDGRPEKSKYRYFHLKERPEGNNDYAMLAEFMERRLDNSELPDLMIVDGGKGQVNTLIKVLEKFDIKIPVVGIAKSRAQKDGFAATEVTRSEERLIIPNRMNPVVLAKHPSLLRMIVQMRDEAHRFSRKLHHNKEAKRVFDSWLDNIPGIGPKTKRKILRKLDVDKLEIKKWSIEQISRKFDLTHKQARSIKEFLGD